MPTSSAAKKLQDRLAPYQVSGDLTDEQANDLVTIINRCYFWQIFGLPQGDPTAPPPPGELPQGTRLEDLILACRRLVHLEHKRNLEHEAQGSSMRTITALPDPRLIAAAYAAYRHDSGTPDAPNIIFARPSTTPGKVTLLCLMDFDTPTPQSAS
mgnify:CR=1 FL=1